MQWQPIEDLPSNWEKLASSELPPLVTVWNEQAERLRSSGEFKTFMERLKREIAIETGIIERLYTLDRGITRLLIQYHHQHQLRQIPPEVEAAWLHHRFTQIHPFQDGNGRVARCLASLVFIQARWFPLVLTRDDRGAYIAASELADQGDLSNLVNLFSRSQKQAFIQSI